MSHNFKKSLYLALRKISDLNIDNYKVYFRKDSILLKYWDWGKNWGDSVNPQLISKLTSREVVSSNSIFNFKNKPELLGVGSIINGDLRNKIIWGSGVISAESDIYSKPLNVLALRGRLSLKKLVHLGVECGVFGDPVLLFPEIYPPMNSHKEYKYGVVPHFKESNSLLIKQIRDFKDNSILIIDPCSEIMDFVKAVLSCENIISSSLHGLILAEAYGIPTLRYVDSNVILGGDFKYDDYYSGVGIAEHDILKFNGNIKEFLYGFRMASSKDLKFNGRQLKECLLNHYA